MIGDVVFFKKDESSFISRAIAKATKSKYTHVGIVTGYDKANNVATIIESDRFVNTRVNLIELDRRRHIVYTVKDKAQEKVDMMMKLSYETIGIKYDYLQILGLFFSLLIKRREYAWFNSGNKFICSELIDIVYYKSGIERKGTYKLGSVTPQELLEVYDFRVREGYKGCLLI